MPNAFNQFAEGYGQGQDMAQGFARQRAGNALAGGDYAGGANALFKGGLLDEGSQAVNFGQKQQDRQTDQHTEEVKHRAEFFMRAADVLSQIPDDGTQQHRRAALQRLTPTFQAMGIDPQAVQALQQADLSDQALQVFKGTIAKQFQMAALGNGGIGAFDPARGTLNVLREPEYEQKYATVPEGGKLVPIPRGNQPAATVEPFAGGALPAAGRASATQADQVAAAVAPLGLALNSAVRTPAQNAAAGGVANSDHLAANGGLARDFQVPPNMTLAQAKATVERRLPAGWKAIAEPPKVAGGRGHIHIQPIHDGAAPAPQAQSGDPAGTIYGAPKGAEWATLSPEEAKGYGPGQYQRNAKTGEVKQVSGTGKGSGKLPPGALTIQRDHLDAIQTSSAINTRLATIAGQIDSGALNLGPVTNVFNTARNAVGASDQQSRNYSSFRANLEKLRNDSLRLNKGVQTEGDAQRAWNEIFQNLNDERSVRQRLGEIEGYNTQALAYHQDAVAQLREDAGLPPIDATKFEARPLNGARPAAAPASQGGGASPPASALQAGHITTFANGQKWTLRNGKPARVQ